MLHRAAKVNVRHPQPRPRRGRQEVVGANQLAVAAWIETEDTPTGLAACLSRSWSSAAATLATSEVAVSEE